MIRLLPVLLLAACAGPEEELDLRDPPEELEVPDLSGVDLDALYADALETALLADTRVVWDPHADTLDLGEPGCPDLFAGTPDLDDDDVPDDTPGWSWADHCTTAAAHTFGGYAWWEDDLVVEGDATSLEGATTQATRTLVADALIADGDDAVLYEFDGEASDSLLRTEGDGWAHWVYSSLVQGTASGAWAFDPDELGIEGGWRTDLYLRATGGDADTLELRGNLHFFEHRLADRFDSVTVNLAWAAPDSLGPEACAEEPRGWIGVRDEEAFWFDVVFQPRFDDDATEDHPYEDDDYGPCDGCGTLYVRGLEQTSIEVCPDLSFLWNGDVLTHPAPEDFALSMRDLLGGAP